MLRESLVIKSAAFCPRELDCSPVFASKFFIICDDGHIYNRYMTTVISNRENQRVVSSLSSQAIRGV